MTSLNIVPTQYGVQKEEVSVSVIESICINKKSSAVDWLLAAKCA
jgi:hypothetical protein